jgi:superfamily I DNA/RNA helicase
MHLRLGQAARHHAQDQTSRHRQRRRRLPAQPDRLQPDPHSQTARGVGKKAPKHQSDANNRIHRQNHQPSKENNGSTSAFFRRLLKQIKIPADDDAEGEADRLPERVQALEAFLNAPFSQVQAYAEYVSDSAPYDTHQGVKGREFERVMVLMDALETRGFMFDYEKLFGAKPQTATDEKNVREGKETSLDRTRRLFYVTCSRARKSLAIVAYSEAPEVVRANMIRNGWFQENEVLLRS